MLLKGCHKRMICIKSADSRLFAEAFFVLRDEQAVTDERSLLDEANRILEESVVTARRRRPAAGRQRLRLLWPFLGGMVGAGLLWLVFLLFFL